LSEKIEFSDYSLGQNPSTGLEEGENGKLYGFTKFGGSSSNSGVLFEYDFINNTYTKKISLNVVNGLFRPFVRLAKASNQKLYAMYDYLVEYDPFTNNFKTLASNAGNGRLLEIAQQRLIGTDFSGGVNNKGRLIEFNISNGNLSTVVAFGANNGKSPRGGLLKSKNGKLYGQTLEGGTENLGTLFEYDVSSNKHSILLNFNGINGSKPNGSLIESSNGNFYGLCSQGGINDLGVLFEYNPLDKIYTKLFDFTYAEGAYPNGSILQANNGKLYGFCYSGGIGYGTIFEFDIVQRSFKKVNISQAFGNPRGSLIQGENGNLFGMTYAGGKNQFGSIIEYNISNNTYTDKTSFSANTGVRPYGSLVLMPGGKMYGLTSDLGTLNVAASFGKGSLFEYDPTNDSLIVKKIFTGSSTGSAAYGTLLKGSDNKLYATTHSSIIKYDPLTDSLAVIVRLPNNNNGGYYSYGDLTQVNNTVNDVLPIVNINDINFIESNDTAKLSACISEPSNSPVSIEYKVSGGQAKAGVDYNTLSGTLTIPPGQTCATIPVSIIDDNIKEPTEDIVINIFNPVNATIGDAYGAINIIDNDNSAPVFVSIQGLTVNENVGIASMKVCLTESYSLPVTVKYRVYNGTTAVAGQDFVTTDSTVTIPAGQTCANLNVIIIDDSENEATENVIFNIFDAVNATISNGFDDIRIMDNDPTGPPSCTSNISPANGTTISTANKARLVWAPNPKISDVEIFLGIGNAEPVRVAYVEGFPGLDGITVFNLIPSTKYSWYVVPINNGIRAVGCGSAKTSFTTGPLASAAVLSIGNANVNERAGKGTVFACLNEAVNDTVFVGYRTEEISATSGLDFVPTSFNEIMILPGETCAPIIVPIVDDNISESTESFNVFLSSIRTQNPGKVTVSYGNRYGIINILDDEGKGVQPVIRIVDTTIVVEGKSSYAVGEFYLSAPTTEPVSFDIFTIPKTAKIGTDLTFTKVSRTFSPGVTSGLLYLIPILNDSIKEPTETFVVKIANPTNATVEKDEGTVVIIDDDSASVTPSLSVSDLTLPEATSPALVNVCLSSASDKDVSFYLTTAAYTASSGADYISLHQQFTIPAGQTCINVPIQIINDNIVEPVEGFTTNLSAITNAAAGDIQGWVYITDDDSSSCPAGTICISNTCPATTVNLINAYSINNLPTGTTASWHTGTPATDANKITAAQAAAISTSGNYYAAINISGDNCYSSTVLVAVNIKSCANAPLAGNFIHSPTEIASKKITISPNPFVNNIQASIQMEKDEKAVLTVMDIFGRQIKSKTVQLSAGKNQVTVDGLGKLPAGNYLLRVKSGTRVETHKIVKQQ
jgi:hypothetical protein